jgi:hypothetical protein
MSAQPRPELTTLSQEIHNRFIQLPMEAKRDPCLALVRIAVEVTREFMQHHPEGVDEFLRLHNPTGLH